MGNRDMSVTELRSAILDAKARAARTANRLNIKIAEERVRRLERQLRRALVRGGSDAVK